MLGLNVEGRFNSLFTESTKMCHAFQGAGNFVNTSKRRILIKNFYINSPIFGCPIVRLWTKTLIKLSKKTMEMASCF